MAGTSIGDAHLHFFSRGVFAFHAGLSSDLAASPDPAAAAAERLGVELPPAEPEALAARWAAELDRHGVARAVLFGSAPGEEHAVARAVAAHPSRFAGFVMVHPPSVPGPEALGRIAALGLRGVLLFPALHQFFPDDEPARRTYEGARRFGLVVFVAIGELRIPIRERLGLPGRHDPSFGDPARLAAALREFPDVRFVVPHFGCGLLEPLLRACGGRPDNLYLDTSGSNAWRQQAPDAPRLDAILRRALDALGPERLLFGSDSTVFPRGWRAEVYEEQRVAADAAGLGAAERAALFGGNLDRLLPPPVPDLP
jgi:predicted TIM-barrel fold metal-dependent hydrolase